MYYHYCFANQERAFLPSYGWRWRKYLTCLWFFKQSDLDHSQNSSNRANTKSVGSGNKQTRPAVSNQRQVLRRSFSQKDLKSHDGYSVRLFLLLWLMVLLLLFYLCWKWWGEKRAWSFIIKMFTDRFTYILNPI